MQSAVEVLNNLKESKWTAQSTLISLTQLHPVTQLLKRTLSTMQCLAAHLNHKRRGGMCQSMNLHWDAGMVCCVKSKRFSRQIVAQKTFIELM